MYLFVFLMQLLYVFDACIGICIYRRLWYMYLSLYVFYMCCLWLGVDLSYELLMYLYELLWYIMSSWRIYVCVVCAQDVFRGVNGYYNVWTIIEILRCSKIRKLWNLGVINVSVKTLENPHVVHVQYTSHVFQLLHTCLKRIFKKL